MDPALIRSGHNIVPAHLSAASSAASLVSELALERDVTMGQLDGAVTSPLRPACETSQEDLEPLPDPTATSTPRREVESTSASPCSPDGLGEQTAFEAQGESADATPSLYPSLGQLEVDIFTFNPILKFF